MADQQMGKVTVFFESEKFGWTESYYRTDLTLSSLITKGKDLVNARRQLLGSGASITAIRASIAFPSTKVSSVLVIHSPNGDSAIFPGKKNVADDPDLSVLVRYNTVGGKRSMKHFSGVPDYLFDRTLPQDFDVTDPLWTAAFVAYQNYIRGESWGIAVKGREGKVFDGFANVDFVRVRRKNRGRVFGLPVGRRTA